MIVDCGATLVVLSEDNVGYETGILIKAVHDVSVRSLIAPYTIAALTKVGHKQSMASVVVPYTIADALEPAESIFHKPAYQLKRWSNRCVGALYRHWVYEHEGCKLLRLPAPTALATE